MNRIKFAIVCFIVLLNKTGFAQIKVTADPLLDSIVAATAEAHKQQPTLSGYRIQIFFGSERKAANEARTKFLQLYPEASAYMIYQQPYFKVRVGDFRTRFEAYAVYKKLIPEFEKIFIIPDKINLPNLNP